MKVVLSRAQVAVKRDPEPTAEQVRRREAWTEAWSVLWPGASPQARGPLDADATGVP